MSVTRVVVTPFSARRSGLNELHAFGGFPPKHLVADFPPSAPEFPTTYQRVFR